MFLDEQDQDTALKRAADSFTSDNKTVREAIDEEVAKWPEGQQQAVQNFLAKRFAKLFDAKYE